MLIGPPLVPLRHTTLQQALAAAARSTDGLTFLDAREREAPLSFADLHRRARRVAGGLRALGVLRGERVALVLPTGPAFVDAFFGALLAGAVPVPLYPPVRLGRLDEYHLRTARMLERSGAVVVVSDARISRLLGVAVATARPRLGLVRADALDGDPVEEEGAPDDLALVQFSSGTTVDPKAVALTHANVLANLAAIDAWLPEDLAVRQSGVSWLPLYHDMGLIGCLLQAVAHPGSLTLFGPELFLARPALWLRAISRRRATISVAPNFAYALCARRVRDEDLAGVDLSSWALALNGAEPVAPGVLQGFAERFAPWGFDPRALAPVYGLSEASLAVTFTPRRRGARTVRLDPGLLGRGEVQLSPGGRDVASVGSPVPGTSIRIRSAEGRELADGSVGRVEVRAPSVMRGYLDDDRATAEVLREGWLDTGDLGFSLGGELYVTGRAKDVIVLRGANHPPQEFEDALDGLDGLRAGCAAAVALPTPEGEELALLAERASGTDEANDAGLADAIRARVVERTGIRPAEVRVLAPGTLPRTSSGKLRRAEARRQLLDDALRPPARVSALSLAREMLRSTAARLRTRRAT